MKSSFYLFLYTQKFSRSGPKSLKSAESFRNCHLWGGEAWIQDPNWTSLCLFCSVLQVVLEDYLQRVRKADFDVFHKSLLNRNPLLPFQLYLRSWKKTFWFHLSQFNQFDSNCGTGTQRLYLLRFCSQNAKQHVNKDTQTLWNMSTGTGILTLRETTNPSCWFSLPSALYLEFFSPRKQMEERYRALTETHWALERKYCSN